MSIDTNPLSRLFRWLVPTGTERENPEPLERTTATAPQSASSPSNDGEPPEDKRHEDSDHEREVLLMLHICC